MTISGPTGLLNKSDRQQERAKEKDEGKEPTANSETDRTAYLVTLLLEAQGRTMEQATHSPPYQLGLMLGLVDTLHWGYCKAVRGDVPSSLGGSQLIGIASDDPPRALSELLERIRPWHAWAETAEPNYNEEAKNKAFYRARKAVGRMSRIAPELAGHLPATLDEIGKAELLLGYLSHDSNADTYGLPPAASQTEESSANSE